MKKNKHESPTVARQRSRQQLYEEGKALRNSCPRAGHADWKPPADRVDPIEILEASNKGRLPELIPVRYGRMIPSPSAFLPWRGRDYGSRPSWFVPDYPIICKNATAKNLALANLRMSEIPAEHTDKLPIDRVPFALAVAQTHPAFSRLMHQPVNGIVRRHLSQLRAANGLKIFFIVRRETMPALLAKRDLFCRDPVELDHPPLASKGLVAMPRVIATLNARSVPSTGGTSRIMSSLSLADFKSRSRPPALSQVGFM
jgi:hypothetical protein